MARTFIVKVADTLEERQSAYKLRYEVFSEEQNDNRYANHDRKEWADKDDTLGSTVFIAVSTTGETIGTIRYTPFQDRDIIAANLYDLPLLASLTNLHPSQIINFVAREDRGVVSVKSRSIGVFRALERSVLQMADAEGKQVIVVGHKSSDTNLTVIFHRGGWIPYKKDLYNGFSAVIAYKLIEKIEHGKSNVRIPNFSC